MNIERMTRGGNAVTIIKDRNTGQYIHPCGKHLPVYKQGDSNPNQENMDENKERDNERRTKSVTVAMRWADELVEMMERAGQ